jgi:hypothetical protein
MIAEKGSSTNLILWKVQIQKSGAGICYVRFADGFDLLVFCVVLVTADINAINARF